MDRAVKGARESYADTFLLHRGAVMMDKRSRQALIDWMTQNQVTHALTLNFNRRELTPARARKALGKLLMLIDEKRGLHGPSKWPTELRLWAIAFVEHPDSNLHYHLCLRFGPDCMGNMGEDGWRTFIDEAWLKLTGAGSIEFGRAKTPERWGRYITKDVNRHGHDYILASDFHPDESVAKHLLA